jgi:succinate dehydrogenase / fumarate reductase cytochrome b subunit
MKPRPLSPHLQIYKPQISSVISILHRFAGIGLCGGLVIFAWWLMAAAGGAESYAQYFLQCAASPVGQIALALLTLCFFFYFLAELRYIAWACGYGFSIPTMNLTGWLVAVGSVALTAVVWSL